MKKLFTIATCVLMASATWAGVINLELNDAINPATIEYDSTGVWTGTYNDVDYTWLEFGGNYGEFMISHLIDGEGASWGGYYWDGFTIAKGGDMTDYGQPGSSGTWTTRFGGCMAGGGCVINADGTVSADPNQPYLVAYYSSWAMEGPSNQVMFVDKDGNMTFEPVGVYVCNHPWPYYGCLHGDGFGRAFEEGDYFELIAHGVDVDGNETTVSMNLVEFTDGELKAANDWTFFDLSSLGEVVSVYFTLNSTDVGDYGMNTAAYFCMDKFQVKDASSAQTSELTVADGNVTGEYAPVYGYNFETPQHNQMQYPAAEMSGMAAGTEITAMKFYTSTPDEVNALGGSVKVSLANLEGEYPWSLDGYGYISGDLLDYDVTTVAATVAPSADENGVWTITFDAPFTYAGGTLLVDIQTVEAGNWKYTYFCGKPMDAYYVMATYGYAGTKKGQNLLPKVTFTINGGETPQPQYKIGDVNHDGDVNIADVTALIDYLLTDPSGAPVEANVNLDDAVNIGDVTALIDYLLTGLWPE
ncbi:MAG: DUF4465 domain-containing protein [Muribaculaceae bacterium]|nr:DUF4465 domain-containing protein [Muribaculaceae bacterium]